MLAPLRRAVSAFRVKSFVNASELPRTGIWQRLVERRPGDWQKRIRIAPDDIFQIPTAFSAQGLISQDFAKLSWRLQRYNAVQEVWRPASLDNIDDLIPRPNAYQNRLQFAESWLQSKLSSGNTYALKGRGKNGAVRALYILDPWRVRPLIAPGGSVFYECQPDDLSGLGERVVVPASEIIHDRFNTIFHKLVGLSPLHPAALSSALSLELQNRAARFWSNNAQPNGALVVPEGVEYDEAKRLKELWETNYGADNLGKTAVLAGGMDYKPFSHTNKDAQMVEQMKLTREEIATAYRLPFYKVGAGSPPSVANTGQLDQEYYSNCLQIHVVSFELCMTLGLELPTGYRLDLDENDILRMDPLTKAQVMKERVTGGWWSRNEARREDNLPPKAGGDDLLVQEQYWPAAAVADPSRGVPTKSSAPTPANDDAGDDDGDSTARALSAFAKGLSA